ncbi:MAG: heparan-alpha-glucosaminide N-acetyltransferase domain-containing protein, partial [Promethearchaeota archaeon]
DYFPLIPWFGATLVGIVLGSILYKDNKRRFYLPDLSKYKSFTMLSWVGKHSLAIYLFHQPVIAGMLFIFVLI